MDLWLSSGESSRKLGRSRFRGTGLMRMSARHASAFNG